VIWKPLQGGAILGCLEIYASPSGVGPATRRHRRDSYLCVAAGISNGNGFLGNWVLANCGVGSSFWIKAFGDDCVS